MSLTSPSERSIKQESIKTPIQVKKNGWLSDVNTGYAEKVRHAMEGLEHLLPTLKSDFYRREFGGNNETSPKTTITTEAGSMCEGSSHVIKETSLNHNEASEKRNTNPNFNSQYTDHFHNRTSGTYSKSLSFNSSLKTSPCSTKMLSALSRKMNEQCYSAEISREEMMSIKDEASGIAIVRKSRGGVQLKVDELDPKRNFDEFDRRLQFFLKRKEIRQQLRIERMTKPPAVLLARKKPKASRRSWFQSDLDTEPVIQQPARKRHGRGRLLKNKPKIINAVKYRLLPGKHNKQKRERVLGYLHWTSVETMIILLRRSIGSFKLHFKGLYEVQDVDHDHVIDPIFIRLFGEGPKTLTVKNIKNAFKFDVASKSFEPVSSIG